jgi:hypothetical protein
MTEHVRGVGEGVTSLHQSIRSHNALINTLRFLCQRACGNLYRQRAPPVARVAPWTHYSAISVATSVRQSLPSMRPTCGESGAVDSLLCDLCANELAALFNNIDKILRCAERVKVRKPPNKANGQSPWLVPEVEELAAIHVPNYKTMRRGWSRGELWMC